MSLQNEIVPVTSHAFREIPCHERLPVISRFFVAEMEQLGYELAHAVEPNAIASLFITARDITSRLEQLQNKLMSETIS